ncbi:ABC transporter ATP-binding protein [uncultured Thomasclavelia sp.]|uniref:ABC transporter ATP-binding protein n=1 Tax=uncultured Thomasclavelia sp. TaxID=3025759 RepID=UPI0025F81109|nr:ABC transporter ATP-binding protein [uncultured Thomasclavelia sp.]
MIEINNIHLQFDQLVLLENEKISLQPGNIYVITGKSGSGKTTLLYEISLLSNISKTKYYFNGKRIDNLNENEIAKIRQNHIGYILQDLELISEELSLKDNLDCMFALNNQEYDEKLVDEYLQLMNLNLQINQKVTDMSRGQRQRFALVMALVKNVELLVLDEPTSALDKNNSIELMEYLKVLARKYHKTIVIASHDQIVIDAGDGLYQIENKHLINKKSQLITVGKTKELATNNINHRFYQIYQKSNQRLSKIMMNVIYVIMLTTLIVGPIIVDAFLNHLQQLYQRYATNEILVVNTKQEMPPMTYNENSAVFNDDQLQMLQAIEHVETASYFYQLESYLDQQITIVPGNDIDQIVVSSSLENQVKDIDTIIANLTIAKTNYQLEISLNNYLIDDYPNDKYVNLVIYMPEDMLSSLLRQQGISHSGTIKLTVDQLDNNKVVINEIKRWLPNATIFSSTNKYQNQITTIQTIEQLMLVLKAGMVVGIVIIVYVIQVLENKGRYHEIVNLRINGISKRLFYQLVYYENRFLIYLSLAVSLLVYFGVVYFLDLKLVFYDIMVVTIKTILYLIITRGLVIILQVEKLFSWDIGLMIRSN